MAINLKPLASNQVIDGEYSVLASEFVSHAEKAVTPPPFVFDTAPQPVAAPISGGVEFRTEPGSSSVRVSAFPDSRPVVNASPEVIADRFPNSGVTIRRNLAKKGIEIVFPGKPADSVRAALKSAGFRWHSTGKYWYRKDDGNLEGYRARFCS